MSENWKISKYILNAFIGVTIIPPSLYVIYKKLI